MESKNYLQKEITKINIKEKRIKILTLKNPKKKNKMNLTKNKNIHPYMQSRPRNMSLTNQIGKIDKVWVNILIIDEKSIPKN